MGPSRNMGMTRTTVQMTASIFSNQSGAMPSLIHNSKSNRRPESHKIILKGVSLGEMSVAAPLVFFQLSDRLAHGGSAGHVEFMHMANPLCYTSDMDLHLRGRGLLDQSVCSDLCNAQPKLNDVQNTCLKYYATVSNMFCKPQAKADSLRVGHPAENGPVYRINGWLNPYLLII